MQLLQAVEQLAFFAELLQHVGQELIGRGALARQPVIDARLQSAERLLGLTAAGGDPRQVEFQQGVVSRDRLRLAEGRLGLGQPIAQEECLAEQFVTLARRVAQQELFPLLVKAETVGMFQGFVDADEFLGGLRILLREMVKAAQLQAHENISRTFRVRRIGSGAFRRIALRVRGDQGLFVELDGVVEFALFLQIQGQLIQRLVAHLVGIDSFQRIAHGQGELLFDDRGEDQVVAGGRGGGSKRSARAKCRIGLGKIAPLLQAAPGSEMGQGLDAIDLGLAAGLAGNEGGGQVVEVGCRGGRQQPALGQGENRRGQDQQWRGGELVIDCHA